MAVVVAATGACLQPSSTPYYQPMSTASPTVLFTVPTDGATGISRTASFQVAFSEEMDPVSVRSGVQLLLADQTPVPYTAVDVLDGGVPDLFEGTPSFPLYGDAGYVLDVGTGCMDPYGNPLAAEVKVHFTTSP